MKTVNIYTDGACSGNQNDTNIGGWGAVLEFGGHEKELWGGEINTTNNRMELTALIEALKALKEGGLRLRIFSDSSYLVNCFKNEWYVNWQKNGWKNSKRQAVENKELWEALLSLLSTHQYEFFLVKGHVKNPSQEHYKKFAANQKGSSESFSFDDFCSLIEYNNRCDALANKYIDQERRLS